MDWSYTSRAQAKLPQLSARNFRMICSGLKQTAAEALQQPRAKRCARHGKGKARTAGRVQGVGGSTAAGTTELCATSRATYIPKRGKGASSKVAKRQAYRQRRRRWRQCQVLRLTSAFLFMFPAPLLTRTGRHLNRMPDKRSTCMPTRKPNNTYADHATLHLPGLCISLPRR